MVTPKILVIEDVSEISGSLVDMIQMRGWHALTASTGHAGIDTALSEHPDVILLDMRLPDIDGYQVYERIRSDSWGATAAIIIITASESVAVIAQRIDLPIDYILFKPEWSLQEVAEKIASLLTE